jgi:elongation factor P
MVSVTDLRSGTYFQENGTPFEVLTYDHVKKGRGNATIKVKVRNVLTGAVINKSYISGKKVEEAELFDVPAVYKYRTSDEYIFVDPDDDDIEMDIDMVGSAGKFLIKNMSVKILHYKDAPIAVRLPIKVTYVVASAPPDARGNSANASYKEVVLENKLRIKTPMFIKEGDRVVVDTRSGDYVNRE